MSDTLYLYPVNINLTHSHIHTIPSGFLQVIALHQNLVFPQYQESLK